MSIEEQAFDFLPKIKDLFKNIPEEAQIPVAYNIIEDAFKKNNLDEEIQCTKQVCSFCCHDQIMLSKQEAEYIKKNANYEIDETLLNKQRSAADFKKLSFADRACIFLKDGRCSVYEHRPIVCRTHNVKKGVDIKNCITKEPNPQAYFIPVQSVLYYFAMKDFPNLKSTYSYDFRRD